MIPAGFLLLTTVLAMDQKPAYPASRTDKVVDKLHGVEIPDAYRWLEVADSPEVKGWVEKQNALTKSLLDNVPGRARIHAQLSKLLEIGTIGTPVPRQGRYFYTRRTGTQNQPVLYVREGVQGQDRVLVDPNTLSKEGTVALDWWYPSRDGRLLAYGTSKDGNEWSTLRVRDVDTGRDLADVIERTRHCSLAWLPDGKGFYYTRNPPAGSPDADYYRHVYFHQLGTDPASDPKVFGGGRPKDHWPNVLLTPNGRWLVVPVEIGFAKTDVYFKDLRQDGAPFVPLVENVEALFDVTPRDDRFYVQTNDKAPRGHLYAVDPARPARETWVELIPEGPDVLDAVDVVGQTLAALYSHKASSRLQLFTPEGKPLQEVPLPTLGTVAGLGGEWNGQELFFGFESVTVAPSIYRMDLNTRQSELWQRVETDIDFSRYEVEQVTYPSKDGTPITMFLAHRKGLQRDGQNPTILTGYGGFNVSMTPTFSASRFFFLESGGLVAIPNLRGGGEYGEEWHRAGMLGKKQNVFDDFVAAAEWLIREKYTNPDRLAIVGGSNGGLLVGAALTQRPDLFRAVVCQVPLLDMVRYHQFLVAELWIPEYGSAKDPEQFKWLYSYSPYHHVKPGTAYPAVLLATAESDSRVDALHARKMAAALQAATRSDRPILLRLETKAGHGAGKPRAKVLEELTDTWCFLFWQLGLAK
jgi:prolyl oligopeptidase